MVRADRLASGLSHGSLEGAPFAGMNLDTDAEPEAGVVVSLDG